MEGIRAREVLLLPQTLKNRRQLAHKLLRYTINEKFRNTPVLLLRDYRLFFFFSFFFDPRSNERTKSFRSSRHVRSKAPPTFVPSIDNKIIQVIDDGYDLSSRRIRKIQDLQRYK